MLDKSHILLIKKKVGYLRRNQDDYPKPEPEIEREIRQASPQVTAAR
jgi:hypothetical protein